MAATTTSTTPKPARRCSLILTINGTRYRVRSAMDRAFDSSVRRAFTLTRRGAEPYTIVQTGVGTTCSCGDFLWRTTSRGTPCKHLRAARAVGLL